jgi:glycerol kinase
MDVVRPKVVEVTALGASYLAGLNVGYWKDIEDIRNNKKIERIFNPTMKTEDRNARIEGWSKAIKMARFNG